MPSIEDEIWGTSPVTTSVAPIPIYKLGPGCDLADHDRTLRPGCSRDPRVRSAMCAAEQNQAPVTMTTPIPSQPVTVVTLPGPAAPPVIPDQTTPLVKAAAALADATTARDRLMRRIEGLELSLKGAKEELVRAEDERVKAQAALRVLVDEAL